jgi:AcrR family transcriptional regulator
VKSSVRSEIRKIIKGTKEHRDAFAITPLVEILRRELKTAEEKNVSPAEMVLEFVDMVENALVESPIYSTPLIREFYRRTLDAADLSTIDREELLEDLLFQSLRRTPESEGTRRGKLKNAKARILKAALQEFSEKGYHSTPIDTIAERAGMAKGTFYKYFKTKEMLFTALKEEKLAEFVELAKKEVKQDADILEILEGVISHYIGFFEQNAPFFKIIIQEQKDFGREFSEKFINELIVAFPGLKRACWKASRDGKLKQLNYFTVFFGIVGFLNGVIQKWLHEGGQGSLVDEVDTIKEVLFYGFALPPGQEARPSKTNLLKVIS